MLSLTLVKFAKYGPSKGRGPLLAKYAPIGFKKGFGAVGLGRHTKKVYTHHLIHFLYSIISFPFDVPPGVNPAVSSSIYFPLRFPEISYRIRNDLEKLEQALEGLKDKYEVKLEKTNDDGQYKATPDGTGNITPTVVTGTGYKGFKHPIPGSNGGTINYISIYNEIIRGVREVENGEGFTTQDGGGLFVYYESDISKPLLICLSKEGKAANSPDNKWYKRTGSPPSYTWEEDNTFNNTHDPTNINTLKTELERIKSGLSTGSNTDTGYPKLDSVEIDISQAPNDTSGEDGGFYRSGGKEIKVEKVQVNQNATGGQESTTWKCYKHFKSDNTQFTLKRITHSDVTMKSSSGTPQLSENMNIEIKSGGAIYVYYQSTTEIDKPRVICISTTGGTTGNTWYKAGTTATTWAEVETSASIKIKIQMILLEQIESLKQTLMELMLENLLLLEIPLI